MNIYSIKIVMANNSSRVIKVKSDKDTPEKVINELLKKKYIKVDKDTYYLTANICNLTIQGGKI